MSDEWNKIACPQCEWEPTAHDKWFCHCGCIWNTFETAAKCPKCNKQWKTTQCIACHKHSPHEDWYRDLSQIVQQEINTIFQKHTSKSD